MKQDYIPGEGCECSARCQCECGCDVDWTPRKVYELREQLAAVTEERDEIKQELENLKASAIHTCHDQCQRPMCAMRRERDALANALRKISEASGFDNIGLWSRNVAKQALAALK